MQAKPYLRKAQFHETDQMGVIHHANYIRWFEEARVDFLEQLGYGYEKSTERGVDFAVTSVSCEYKSMVRFGESALISMSVTELTASRMTISYEVRDAATGALRCTGTSGHCYFDNAKRRPVSLKKVLPEMYALLESSAAGLKERL
jgi:acyl-CoA thioester hydrolase